jgi:hypothetical protein
MIQFESKENIARKNKSMDVFINTFGGIYKKSESLEYKILNINGDLIAYSEVIISPNVIRYAYPLSITITRFNKLISKRLNPVLIWSCDDGIIYAKAMNLIGTIKYDKLLSDFVIYFDKQKEFKYIRYIN